MTEPLSGSVPKGLRALFPVTLLVCFSFLPAAPVAPDFIRDPVLEGQAAVRFFGMGERVEPLLEISGYARRDLDGLASGGVSGTRLNTSVSWNAGPLQVRAGAYVKPFPGWRLGVFYGAALGLVHEDDWTNFLFGSGSDWGWRQGLARLEHLVTLDVTHRAAIPGALGLSGELKCRSTWNLSVGQTEIMLRPGLYYTPPEGPGAATLYFQNELWLRPYDVPGTSLKEMVVWENWLYGGVQISLADETQLGLSLAWKHTEWHEGPFWRNLPSVSPYRRGYDAFVPGVSLTHRIQL